MASDAAKKNMFFLISLVEKQKHSKAPQNKLAEKKEAPAFFFFIFLLTPFVVLLCVSQQGEFKNTNKKLGEVHVKMPLSPRRSCGACLRRPCGRVCGPSSALELRGWSAESRAMPPLLWRITFLMPPLSDPLDTFDVWTNSNLERY
jgi:hypothetical protein